MAILKPFSSSPLIRWQSTLECNIKRKNDLILFVHLESARISEQRTLPVHEVVETANLRQRVHPRPHAKMIGIAWLGQIKAIRAF